MASLLGKADPTLVKGAFAVAAANVPGDMSKIYAKREATQKKWMAFAQELQTAWDNKDIEWNNDLAEIEKQSGEAIINQTKGKQNSHAMQLVSDIVTDRTNYYKSFKNNRNSIEEKKIQGELTQFANTIKLNSERYSRMINGDFIIQGTGDEIKLWNQIMKDYNNDTNVSNLQYNDSDIVYTYGDLSMTLAELENKLVTHDSTPGTAVQKTINGVLKTSIETNRPGDDEYKADIKGQIKGIIRKRKDRINVMHTRLNGLGGFTFFEALTGKGDLQEQIYNTLENLSGIGLDLNKDNIKDSEVDELGIPNFDYTTAANAELLQDAILDSPYSIEIVSDFIVENMFDKAYNRGKLDNQNTITEDGRGSSGKRKQIKEKVVDKKLITGTVKVGMTRIGSGVSQIKVPVEQVDAKYNKIVGASSGGKDVVVEGWEGGRTYRYVYDAKGGYWRYQIFDTDLQGFRTHGGLEEDNAEVQHLTTKQVLGGSHLNINRNNSNLGGGTSTSVLEQITW